MNLGDAKSKILLDAVERLPSPPKAVLELGTYCGYSAILLASKLQDPTARVYTLDICEDNVAIARQLIAHAGLNDRVVHVVKPLEQSMEVLITALQSQGLSSFDLVFIDHDKAFYLSDLQLLLESGLLRDGTVVVADNLLIPGAPDYREWISDSDDFQYVEHMVKLSPGANGHHRGPSGREAKSDIVGVGIYRPSSA
eukprot:GHUV01025565.1.p3 GENE.GHUV01025565.1~~GHUV01025565.1.p3  ORF type:complete len:197 (+),score=58.32 GHUV01025565.1:390-980(+)